MVRAAVRACRSAVTVISVSRARISCLRSRGVVEGASKTLLRSNDAFRAYFRARDALFAGQSAEALAEIERAITILPDDENIRFLRAGALLFNNRVAAAQSEIRALIARRPAWQTIIESLASKGLLALPPDLDVDSFLRP
jgi:Flp pilus assembly protein TadD